MLRSATESLISPRPSPRVDPDCKGHHCKRETDMKVRLTWAALAVLFSVSAHAQSAQDDVLAGDPTEFVDSDATEMEPMDRLEANRKAYLPVSEEGWLAA